MAKRDLVDDLVDLLYPLPDRAKVRLVKPGDDPGDPDGDPEADGRTELTEEAFTALYDGVERQRREFEDNVRAVQEASPIVLAPGHAPVDVDPLITELHRAHADQQDAESRLRLLLAYAREFTPHAYSLSELGRAAGISSSGVRTVYTSTDVGRVYELLGRTPHDIVGLRGDAGPNECAVIAGKRNQRATHCTGTPTTVGGAPGTDQLFSVCTPHAYLVSNPRPTTRPTTVTA